jgi:MFS superfamily sulfate permease-like transporter
LLRCLCCCSQFKYILGYNVPRKDTLHEQIAVLVEHGAGFNSKEFAMGMSLLALLVCLMVLSRRYPKRLFWLAPLGPMAAAIIGIIVVVVGKFNYLGDCCQLSSPCAVAASVSNRTK